MRGFFGVFFLAFKEAVFLTVFLGDVQALFTDRSKNE